MEGPERNTTFYSTITPFIEAITTTDTTLKIVGTVLGLGVTALATAAVVRHRGTSKFSNLLIKRAKAQLSGVDYVERGQPTLIQLSRREELRINTSSVELFSLDRAILLKGPHRSGTVFCAYNVLFENLLFKFMAGKTVALSRHILQSFPPITRSLFPPRGLYLLGDQQHNSMHSWLQQQLSTLGKDDAKGTLMDLVLDRYDAQPIRGMLLRTFGPTWLPRMLHPQPSIIIIDQAEELLRKHRGEFLSFFYLLIKEARDCAYFKLVFVINSEAAVHSFQVLNGGTLFVEVSAPQPDEVDVQRILGEEFAGVFLQCGKNLGITADYFNCRDPEEKKLRPDEFYEKKRKQYIDLYAVLEPVTKTEFDAITTGKSKREDQDPQ